MSGLSLSPSDWRLSIELAGSRSAVDLLLLFCGKDWVDDSPSFSSASDIILRSQEDV